MAALLARIGTPLLMALLCACTPSWDWRELDLQGAELRASFPCKPVLTRQGGSGLAVCEAQGMSVSVAWSRLETVEQMRTALREGPGLLGRRLGLPMHRADGPVALPDGAMAQAEAGYYEAAGQACMLSWARGLTVYQALARGGTTEQREQFLRALRHARP